MDFPQRAVFFLEEDSSLPAHSKPLMLEAVLFCPILRWMSDKLLADGVQRFFAVSSPRFAQEVRACFPEDADVTISEQHSELLDFLNTPDPVAVFVRAALPMEEAGPGFVYGAPGYELQAVWREKMTNAVSAAELLSGEGVSARVLDFHTIKPLDTEAVNACIADIGKIVTVEDHNILNGLGSAVCEVAAEMGKGLVKRVGIRDQFGQSAPYERLLAMNGVTVEDIVAIAESMNA